MMPAALTMKLVWRSLASFYAPMNGATVEVSDVHLDRVQEACRTKLSDLPALAGRPFVLPEALRLFYRAAQDHLQPIRPEEGFRFYDSAWLATDGFHLASEAAGDSAPWLEIGSFAADDWVFICCDPEDELFGHVVRRQNATPWSEQVYERETWPDLMEFLKDLAPGQGSLR